MPLLRNILIFHSGALGDLVLSFPLALTLARLHPTSRIRYVTTGQKGRLAARMLGVEAVDVEGGYSALFAEGAAVSEGVAAMLAGAQRVVSFISEPGDEWSGRVAELAPGARLMHLRTIPAVEGMHALEWLKRQVAGDKAMGPALEQIASLLSHQGLIRRAAGGRGVVLHPGAGARDKCWPVDSFRELALRLKDDGEDVRWVLGEVELEHVPASDRRAMEALGDVLVPGDLVGLLEELSSASAFVGNDSGPGHVAAIAGVPTVSLFGPTDPAVWKPIGPRVEVVSDKKGDMSNIAVGEVYQAFQRATAAATSER